MVVSRGQGLPIKSAAHMRDRKRMMFPSSLMRPAAKRHRLQRFQEEQVQLGWPARACWLENRSVL